MHDGDTQLFATGRYLDRIDVGGHPLALHRMRTVVLDSQKIDTLLVIPLLIKAVVIASGAKQSRGACFAVPNRDCRVASLLAMTGSLARDGLIPMTFCSAAEAGLASSRLAGRGR